MGDTYAVRGVFILFALGAAAVLFARGFAYWLEWEPRTVRLVGAGALGLGICSVFGLFGAGTGLETLVAGGTVTALYVWQDVLIERKDELKRAAERERMLEQFGREDRKG